MCGSVLCDAVLIFKGPIDPVVYVQYVTFSKVST